MPLRTCDLGELADLVERRARDAERPVLVAIAGIETSGKSTLASLLADRLADRHAGSAVLHTGAALPPLDRHQWVARGRAAMAQDPGPGAGEDRTGDAEPRVVILEGSHTLPPASEDTIDVRVWMDVSPNTAAGWRIHQRVQEAERRESPPPYGTWHAFPPAGTRLDAGQADADPPPPGDADALFVPVSGMVPPIRIRFMPEAGCDFVLWDDDNEHLGDLEDLLPMPPELRAAVRAWAERSFQLDGGILRPSPHKVDLHRADGQRLSRELQEALGPDYTVMTWV